MDMGHKITASHANIHNSAQLAQFLAPIPNAGNLESLLMERKAVSTRSYDDDTMIARFVRSDGTAVVCYAVEEVTIDEGEMIAAQCELLELWNLESFSRAVHIALDPEI
jgi:hypothetical protein